MIHVAGQQTIQEQVVQDVVVLLLIHVQVDGLEVVQHVVEVTAVIHIHVIAMIIGVVGQVGQEQ